MSLSRVLAIDPGTVRLGLAVSDLSRRIASPLATWTRRDLAQDERYLRKVLDDEAIGLVVIGLPTHMSGQEGTQAERARAFGSWLHAFSGIPAVYYDERYSSSEAESHLRDAGLSPKQRKARRDQVAAQIFLQAFLDAGCPLEFKPTPIESDPRDAAE